MSSVTGLLLNFYSHHRNPMGETQCENIYGRIFSEVIFVGIVQFAIVEVAISSVAYALSSIFCSDQSFNRLTHSIDDWTHSSVHCLAWNIYAIAMNLFVTEMFTTEEQFISTQFPNYWNSRLASQQARGPSGLGNGQNNSLFSSLTSLFAETFLGSNPRLDAYFSGPPQVEPEVANLLNQYELGPNATVPSEIMQRLYNDIPQPTDLELRDIGTQIADLLTDRVEAADRRGIKSEIDGFVVRSSSGIPWDTRFVKMLVCIRKEILRRNDPSEIEIMKQAFKSAFGHCSNRKSREIERLFFAYVAPHLNADYVMSMTPKQCLIFDLTQHRMDFSDKTINYHSMNDPHLASSSNVFHRHLNTSTFYLPPAPLSDVDHAFESVAAIDNENAIKETFKKCYESPNTIYTVFLKLLYSHESSQEERDQFKFKPVMFTNWLQGLNSSDPLIADDPSLLEDPLTEDGYFKHALIVKYLAAMDCLTLRNSLNEQSAAS